MLTVTGLWFDHERTPVGLDHTPVFGWQLEGNCRNIRQTQYRLQVALTPDFAALLYDETCETNRRCSSPPCWTRQPSGKPSL